MCKANDRGYCGGGMGTQMEGKNENNKTKSFCTHLYYNYYYCYIAIVTLR